MLRVGDAVCERANIAADVAGGAKALKLCVQVRDAGNLLSGAHFSLQTVDTEEVTLRYGDAGQSIAHLRVCSCCPAPAIFHSWGFASVIVQICDCGLCRPAVAKPHVSSSCAQHANLKGVQCLLARRAGQLLAAPPGGTPFSEHSHQSVRDCMQAVAEQSASAQGASALSRDSALAVRATTASLLHL